MPALADISPLWQGLYLVTKKFDLTYAPPQMPFSPAADAVCRRRSRSPDKFFPFFLFPLDKLPFPTL